MMKRYDELIQVKQRFDFQYKNQEYLYTYIAPKEKDLFNRFTLYAMNTPALSASMYEILSNSDSVRHILKENFSKDIELEIYVASDDRYSSFTIQGSLKDYITRENIDFEY